MRAAVDRVLQADNLMVDLNEADQLGRADGSRPT